MCIQSDSGGKGKQLFQPCGGKDETAHQEAAEKEQLGKEALDEESESDTLPFSEKEVDESWVDCEEEDKETEEMDEEEMENEKEVDEKKVDAKKVDEKEVDEKEHFEDKQDGQHTNGATSLQRKVEEVLSETARARGMCCDRQMPLLPQDENLPPLLAGRQGKQQCALKDAVDSSQDQEPRLRPSWLCPCHSK